MSPASTLHTHPNLDTSDESKQHSKEVLDQEFNGGNIDTSSGEKNPQNVAGGLKAYVPPFRILIVTSLTPSSTTKNPNVSDEAKESAQERLKEMGQ